MKRKFHLLNLQSVAEVTEAGQDVFPLVEAIVHGSGDNCDLWEFCA